MSFQSPVSESRIIDLLTQAANRILLGDSDGAHWVFYHCMSDRERVAFDLYLVRTKDELGFLAGTTFDRFRLRVTQMVEREEQRRKLQEL